MSQDLSQQDLKQLISSAFPSRDEDKGLAIIVDVPDDQVPDNDKWRTRRKMAKAWAASLQPVISDLGLEKVTLVYYPNVHSNNADLPANGYVWDGDPGSLDAPTLTGDGKAIPFERVFSEHQIILAPTEFSTTAPLKLNAKTHGYRAATMPGFSSDMIPSLKLDYGEINRQVQAVKEKLDRATGAEIEFLVHGSTHHLHLDLRHRTAHASGGFFPEPPMAGNLPSGEAYIVPYEGEKGEPSKSSGTLPVQFGDEVVLYRIEANKAVEVTSMGPASAEEAEKIRSEPAYANLSEAGFGVLAPFGVKPIGEMLLDEKLGLHIAFGRSDHFGGAVGIKDFSSPENVVHIDRIYIPETQPDVEARYVDLTYEDGSTERLMEKGEYTIFG
ncbi:MAG: hypothetical protein KAW17_08850 [Candidatus Eisenbacteria sp.]|nr:hypothetical protein [Candidatus Eisenbacteria bacterium]